MRAGSTGDPVRAAGMSELRRELCDSLAGISPRQAQVVVLKDALGYSFEEIAEAAGHAGRHREMPCAPRPQPAAGALEDKTSRDGPGRAPFGRDVIEQLIPHRAAVPARRRDRSSSSPGKRVRRAARDPRRRLVVRRPLPATGRSCPACSRSRRSPQAGAVAVLADEANRGKIPFFAGIDDCRFKRIVEPGDVLTLECEFVRVRGPIAKGRGRARVDGEIAAEAMLTVFVGE